VLAFLTTRIWGQAQQHGLEKFRLDLQNDYKVKQKKISDFLTLKRQAFHDSLLIVDVQNGKPVYRIPVNVTSAITTRASSLQSGVLGVTLLGEGMTIGMWDDGLLQSHQELAGRIVANEGTVVKDHATHVAGTLGAQGISTTAKGMAPKAKIFAHYFDNDLAEMAGVASSDQSSLLISNHSYGQATGWYRAGGQWQWAGHPDVSQEEDYFFGFYGNDARLADQLAFLAPYYTIVWAAGNDRAESGDGSRPADCNKGTGYDCIIPDATGKNIITVGAVNAVSTYNGASSVVMSSFSSWGPTDDGRIKPDLVANGVNVFSLSAMDNNTYATFSGTSMAAPNVAGSLLLLQELYGKLNSGAPMRAATLKGLAVHTAREAGSAPGPDYQFGWGLLDVEAAAQLIIKSNGIDKVLLESNLTIGGVHEYSFKPKANEKVIVTLSWTDPPGTSPQPQLDPTQTMLVNDLDIKVTDNAGNEIQPWILDPGNPGIAATRGDNVRDNIEKIEFTPTSSGDFKLVVSHKGSLQEGSQAYSLIFTYESQASAPLAYYWIGDSGNWNDPLHWSLTSGGASAGTVPGNRDLAIFDDRSFTDSENNTVEVINEQSIRAVRLLSGKPISFNLTAAGLLLVNQSFSACEDFTLTGTGILRFITSAKGEIFWAGNTVGATVDISGGEWLVRGTAEIEKLQHTKGSLVMHQSNVKAAQWISEGSEERKLELHQSTLKVTSESVINGSNLTTRAVQGKIMASGNSVDLNWQQVNWSGLLEVVGSNNKLIGNNTIKKVMVSGKLHLNGSNQIDSLVVSGGSMIQQNGATQQRIGYLDLQSGPANQIRWQGASSASIKLRSHEKHCFDYLNVTDLTVETTGVVTAGLNSSLSQTIGILSRPCAELLLADFTVNYPCVGGKTQFVADESTGATQWQWSFPDGTMLQGDQIEKEFGAVGPVVVNLSISNSSISHSLTKTVNIVANTIPANQVLLQEDKLVSFQISPTYRWMRGEQQLQEVSRSIGYEGVEGVYRVITFDTQCSRISAALTITNIAAGDEMLSVFPNPASTQFEINTSRNNILTAAVYNMEGRMLMSTRPEGRNTVIDVQQIPPGIYLLDIATDTKRVRQKLVVIR